MKPRYLPSMSVLVEDWLTSPRTSLMTAAQEGAFWRLCLTQWREGSLPSSLESCYRLGRITAAEDIDGLVAEAIPLDADGARRCAKVVRTRCACEAAADARHEAGKKAGLASAQRRSNDRSTIVNHPSPNPSPNPKNPPTPQGESRSGKVRADPEAELTGRPPWVVQVARAWLAYRTEKRLDAYTPSGFRVFLGKLEAVGQARSQAALAHSMGSNYQGFYEPGKGSEQPRGPAASRPAAAAYTNQHRLPDDRLKELLANG